jgi:hypothetical protein
MPYTPTVYEKIVLAAIKRFKYFLFFFIIFFIALLLIIFFAHYSKFTGRKLWVIGSYLAFSSLFSSSYFDIHKTIVKNQNPIYDKSNPRIGRWIKVEFYVQTLWILGFILIFISELNIVHY